MSALEPMTLEEEASELGLRLLRKWAVQLCEVPKEARGRVHETKTSPSDDGKKPISLHHRVRI